MKFIRLSILPIFVLLAACGGQAADEIYPDVSTRPERPEATLSAERREELTRELREAQDEAIRDATEGRPASTAGEGTDVVGDEDENEDSGTEEEVVE